jgi:hypothetical protein
MLASFLGLNDPWIITAYVGCILSAALCLGYGLVTWGKGAQEPPKSADKEWAEHEDKISEQM